MKSPYTGWLAVLAVLFVVGAWIGMFTLARPTPAIAQRVHSAGNDALRAFFWAIPCALVPPAFLVVLAVGAVKAGLSAGAVCALTVRLLQEPPAKM
jgi:hypothetical protein